MGYAGNSAPQFVIPSAVATRSNSTKGTIRSHPNSIEDLDVLIGDEAIANSKYYSVGYPIRHGQVDNWDWMEAYWAQSLFKYLRCNPEDHYFLLARHLILFIDS